MTRPGPSATLWIATTLGFSLGLLPDVHWALGQESGEILPAPRVFEPSDVTDGSQYAGMDYDPHGFSPPTRRAGSAMPVMEGEIVSEDVPQDGEIIYEGQPRFLDPGMGAHFAAEEGDMALPTSDDDVKYQSETLPPGTAPPGHCDSCGGDGTTCSIAEGCGSCGSWDGCGNPDCDQCIPLCLPRPRFMSVWAGVHGFTNSLDTGQTPFDGAANFGFQEGINISGRLRFLRPQSCLGYQVGYQAAQSRLSGDLVSDRDRVQHFLTAGLFRRATIGLQGGAVVDLLWDDELLVGNKPLGQVRASVGIVGPRGGEIGFWGAFRTTREKLEVTGNSFVGSVNQYLFYYRRNFAQMNGEYRFWVGGTEFSDAVLGADFLVPATQSTAIQGGFNYLIPRDRENLGALQESWNIGINFVWYPGRQCGSQQCDPFRPLFTVADNGLMFVDRIDID